MLGANRSLRLLCVYVHQYSGAGLGWSSPGVFSLYPAVDAALVVLYALLVRFAFAEAVCFGR